MTDSPGNPPPIPFNAVYNCIVDWPQWPNQWAQPWAPMPNYQPLQFVPVPSLSDADVDRIARRVAELLKSP